MRSNIKWIIPLMLVGFVVIVSGCIGQLSNETGSQYNVEIKDNAFVPQTLTVKAGAPISWINKDSVAHTVTFNTIDEQSSDIIEPGEIFTHAIGSKGTFNYHCTIHTFMTGTIVAE